MGGGQLMELKPCATVGLWGPYQLVSPPKDAHKGTPVSRLRKSMRSIGYTVKLRETPKARRYQAGLERGNPVAEANHLG